MKARYTLDDLTDRSVLDMGESSPARLAVLGYPIAHSASPIMHQAALDSNGINARYIRLEVEPGKIPEAFARMQALGFIGCNVTVPHKLEAMANCTEVCPKARKLGAVNTVVFDGAAIRGFNTDGPGFQSAIGEDFGINLEGLSVAIAGAGGGAGQAIATQCVMAGVARLVLINRTIGKLEPITNKLNEIAGGCEIITLSFEDGSMAEYCLDCSLIVNTSSLGLKAGDPSVLNRSCLRPGQQVYDTIYQPPLTPFLALANEVGCRTSNGLSMLIHQGALAFQQWFPGTAPIEVMRTALTQRD